MKDAKGIRRGLSLVLAAVMCLGAVPGRAAEVTEPEWETVPEESTVPWTEPTESTVPVSTGETEGYTQPSEEGSLEETIGEATEETAIPEETEPAAVFFALEETPEIYALARQGSQETPMPATSDNSVATLGSGSGIKFRIFNYTNGKDAAGDYITAGGINDNGLSGYFDFRGNAYENTGADGKRINTTANTKTDVDGYTANHATVLPNLGSDGYPVFDGSRGGGPKKSLGYLFGGGGKGVTGYAPGNTLLRQNSRGQYYYNSADNAADFDVSANRFIVRSYRERGESTAGMGSGQYYDFFPFTYWNGTTVVDAGTAGWYNYSIQEVDYWFGMTMEAAFSMPAGGRVGADPMVFEFSGDDDVWVFLDDVLVLDLGGTHGVVSGSINFATGEVKQYLDWDGAGEGSAGTSYPTTLKARFQAAGKTPAGGWNGNVFANYTEHTIKFYYLERAASCANCKILFNMPILPTGRLSVEKQVEGTLTELTGREEYTFALVQTAESGEKAAAGVRFDRIDAVTGAVVDTGTTNAAGEFTLKAGQRAEFDLTAGKSFLVRETDAGDWAEPFAVTVNGTPQPVAWETESVTIDPDFPAVAVFTNRLKTTSLSVEKQVAGNLGDRDQEFAFRVRLYTADPGSGGKNIPWEGDFRLRHGQIHRMEGIPAGAWAVITEELPEGYETRWETAEDAGSGRTASLPALTGQRHILYTNTCNVQIGTGVSLDTMPYILMAATGLLLPERRKRRNYERTKNRGR